MATTEQYSLRWNNFHSNLTSGFHELLECSDMVDVTLAVEGHFYQAHKVVLSICSPYFKQMFKVNPCKHPIVILKDVASKNMKDILEFMYMGEVNVLRENLGAFLRTAELLQVKGLTGDDSSETSSRKDDKADSIPDTEEPDLTQVMDSDVELPQHYSTPRPQTPPQSQSTKRPTKTLVQNPNVKRVKAEKNHAVKTENETVNERNEENDVVVKSEEEAKDNLKQILENTFGNGGSQEGSDQGVKPCQIRHSSYQCEKCLKRFSRRDHLRTHEKNIHGEDAGPFACVICSQLYKNAESLRKHIAKFHFPRVGEVSKVEVNA